MRKLIPIIFIFVCCSNASLAQITCTQSATTNCESGCYYTETSGCKICDDGKYTANTGSTSCSDCNKPSVATFTSAGTFVNDCSWEITCNAGEHYVSNTTQSGCTQCAGDTFTANSTTITSKGYGTTQNCQSCGVNSTANANHTNCNCKQGYHIKGKDETETKNNGTTECVANTYTITYIANNGTGFTIKRDATYDTYITTLTSDDDNKLVNHGYKLSAWENDDEKLSIPPGNSFRYNIQGNLDLTAVWAGKTFTITYDVNGADCSLTDQKCQFGYECLVKDVNNCKYPGHVFSGWDWECESGCENSNETIINLGDDISKLSGGENMTLKAIWDPCPAGYYCPNINTEKCPAGSTSAAQSTAITQCYMVGGTTQICDKNNKCFTLPAAVGNIFYHGTQQ